MRLFTALWPTAAVVDALAEALPELGAGWRRTPPERWHVTLAFHGEDEPSARARDLDERLSGALAPTLRTAGAGTFPGVLWAGVETAGDEDTGRLRALVAGAGGDAGEYVAHLTLARARRRSGSRPPTLLPGPWWTPSEVVLVASERDAADGLRYRPVHRVPLTC